MRPRFALPVALLLIACLVAPVFSRPAPVKVHRKNTEPRAVAIIKHKGPHSGIPAAVKELYAKLEEGGYHICGPLMKVYYNDPSKTPDDELLWDVRIAVTNPGSMLKVEMGELKGTGDLPEHFTIGEAK